MSKLKSCLTFLKERKKKSLGLGMSICRNLYVLQNHNILLNCSLLEMSLNFSFVTVTFNPPGSQQAVTCSAFPAEDGPDYG